MAIRPPEPERHAQASLPYHRRVFMLAETSGTSSIGRDLLVILAVAGLVGLFLRRLRLAIIPGYLVAGAVIGPHALRLVRESETVESITHLATILLMFTLGLHMDLSRLRGELGRLVAVTAVSTIAAALLCWPVYRLLGISWPAALAASMAFTISSTAVVIRILMQRGELEQVHGRLSFGVLVMQDLAAMGLLALIPLLAAWERGGGAPVAAEHHQGETAIGILSTASLAVGGVAAMIVAGRWVLPRLLREAAGDGGEVLLVVSSAIALASAALTTYFKLSAELGAFIAGFLLAGTTFRYQLAGQLVPMRDLFMAVFFTVVGMDVPLSTVLQQWWVLALIVPGLMAVKALAVGGSAWCLGVSPAVAAVAGVALAQGGEFSLVILKAAQEKSLLTEQSYGLLVAIVVLSLMLTPTFMSMGHRVGHAMSRLPASPWLRSKVWGSAPEPSKEDGLATEESEPLKQHVIIAGFGPVGSAVADELEKQGIPIAIIDLNPTTVRKYAGLRRWVVYGDAGNTDVLESAGLAHAQAIVLTMPDEDAILRACRTARTIKPDIFIAARAIYLSRALRVMQEGADHTVVEEMATAEAMAAQVMIKLAMRAQGVDSTPRLYAIE